MNNAIFAACMKCIPEKDYYTKREMLEHIKFEVEGLEERLKDGALDEFDKTSFKMP